MSDSLFNRLQRYRSTEKRDQDEDFFTEVVRGLFEHRPELLRAWFRHLKIGISDEAEFIVDTQRPEPGQTDKDKPRRIDLFVNITEPDGRRTVVFVESKLGAREGKDQLSDYAGILARSHSGADRRVLVYVTKHFDDKTESEVLDGFDPDDVEFKLARWHDFYRLIASKSKSEEKTDYFVDNVLRFMEENGMDTANQFGPDELIAFRAIEGALNIMREVQLDSAARFDLVVKKNRQLSAKFDLKHARFVHEYPARHLHVMLGFFLGRDGDYPTLGLMLQVSGRKSVNESGALSVLRAWRKRDLWESDKLETNPTWPGIVRERSLRTFLHEKNQVEKMQDYCDKLLDELKIFRDANADWFTPSDTVDEEESDTE